MSSLFRRKPKPLPLPPQPPPKAARSGRDITPELIAWLDERIVRAYGNFPAPFQNKDPQGVFLVALEAMVGIREATNRNDGFEVSMIQDTIGGAINEAWCMSAQQSAVAYAEHHTGRKSLLYPSEHCMTTWRKSPESMRIPVEKIRPGDILILNHQGSDSGHVWALRARIKGSRIETLEGNTTQGIENEVIVREGGGFYICRRNMNGEGNMVAIGWLRPF